MTGLRAAVGIYDWIGQAARRKFTKCHGRCVQKFCLPVGILSEFEKCKEKCKDICTTSQ